MIHFTSMATYAKFQEAINCRKNGQGFINKIHQLLNRDIPCQIYLQSSNQENYFDFCIYKMEVDVYSPERPDLNTILAFAPKRETVLINGGLMLSSSGWGAHT